MTASARVALEGIPMGPQREAEERVKRTEERNERAANSRRGRGDLLERSQSVQETRAKKTARKTIERCESEPVRAKKTKPRGPTIEELFPGTTISDATKYVGAIVGPDKAARAKEFNKKRKQITSTLRNLKHLKDARAEYQILRYRGVAWARYLPTIMPRRGAADDAVEAYVSGIDAAISDELARLLGDDSVKNSCYGLGVIMGCC